MAESIGRGQTPQDNLREQAGGPDGRITSIARAARYRWIRAIDQTPEGNLSDGTMVAQLIDDLSPSDV